MVHAYCVSVLRQDSQGGVVEVAGVVPEAIGEEDCEEDCEASTLTMWALSGVFRWCGVEGASESVNTWVLVGVRGLDGAADMAVSASRRSMIGRRRTRGRLLVEHGVGFCVPVEARAFARSVTVKSAAQIAIARRAM